MGENYLAALHVAIYGIVLLGAAIAYFILVRVLIAVHDKDSVLSTVIGNDFNGKISVVIYIIAKAFAFRYSGVSGSFYVLVAIMWLVPDRRIEKNLS
jgi:uncharacterized membrane protein